VKSGATTIVVPLALIAGTYGLSLLVIAGMRRPSNAILWGGIAVIAAYSILFLFSCGGILIPPALALASTQVIPTRLVR
jgi:hypothetical protein